jgi:putative colanic acid biosynthesis UDP-glucose lipid carrier transferase
MLYMLERLAAFLLLVLWTPVLGLIGLLIKLTSPGPVIYSQVRFGKGGDEFTVYKLRSMFVSGNDASIIEANDPRITPFGSFLRRTRLDELPQLWNIVLGEMAFVGPRPHNIADTEAHTRRFGRRYTNRYMLRPGLYSLELRWKRGDPVRRLVACDELFRMRKTYWLSLTIFLKSSEGFARFAGKTF